MGSNDNFESVSVEPRDPGWKFVEDIFTWFDERQDEKWIVMGNRMRLQLWPSLWELYMHGMPNDLPLVEVITTHMGRDKHFHNYVFAYLGVKADPSNLDRGKTNVRHTYIQTEGAQERELMSVHVWSVVLIARDVEAKLMAYWHANPRIPVYGRIRGPIWNTILSNMTLSHPNDMRVLADGVEILRRNPLRTWKTKRGGAHNVKVADKPAHIRKALGKRYVELRDCLTNVRKDAKSLATFLGDGWREQVLKKYPIFEKHLDLLEEIAPYREPSNPEASDGEMAPWQITWEIAARETIPDYVNRSVSADALKKTAILPDKGKKQLKDT